MFIRLFIDALSLGYGNHECDGYHGDGDSDNDIYCKRFAEHKCADNNGMKALNAKVEANKLYTAVEALELIKETAVAKFDESVDAPKRALTAYLF